VRTSLPLVEACASTPLLPPQSPPLANSVVDSESVAVVVAEVHGRETNDGASTSKAGEQHGDRGS